MAGTDRVKQMFSMNLPGDLLRNVNRSGMYKMLSDFYHPRDFDAGEQVFNGGPVPIPSGADHTATWLLALLCR